VQLSDCCGIIIYYRYIYAHCTHLHSGIALWESYSFTVAQFVHSIVYLCMDLLFTVLTFKMPVDTAGIIYYISACTHACSTYTITFTALPRLTHLLMWILLNFNNNYYNSRYYKIIPLQEEVLLFCTSRQYIYYYSNKLNIALLTTNVYYYNIHITV